MMKTTMHTFVQTTLTTLLSMLMVLLSCSSAQAGVEITYFYTDLLGSPVVATDQNGVERWYRDREPYGTRREGGSLSGDELDVDEYSLQYTGQSEDYETGLTYHGARYYNSDVGRFYAMDPVGVIPDRTHSFNRYAYANNNPYLYIDPDGRLGIAAVAVGIAVAFALEAGSLALESHFNNGETCGDCVESSGAGIPGSIGAVATKGLFGPAKKFISKYLSWGVKKDEIQDEVYEIIEGVRRSKAADLVGNKTIPAEIHQKGKQIGVKDVPIDSLRSPNKNSIDISNNVNSDRFFDTLDKTKAGSTPPPITIQPGNRGIRVRDIEIDLYGQ